MVKDPSNHCYADYKPVDAVFERWQLYNVTDCSVLFSYVVEGEVSI